MEKQTNQQKEVPAIPEFNYMQVRLLYTQDMQGYVMFDELAPWVQHFVEPEMKTMIVCKCGCGGLDYHVSKENFDKVIARVTEYVKSKKPGV